MRRGKTTVLLALVLALSMMLPAAMMPAEASNATDLPDYIPVDLNSGLAGDVYMPEISDSAYSSSEYKTFSAATAAPVGTEAWDWYLAANGFSPYITLRAINDYAEIWVANDLAFPDGDPRNDDPYHLMITDEMCNYLADQIASVIYPMDTGTFGVPPDRDGTNTIFEQLGWPAYRWDWINSEDSPQRVMVKVMNIVDTGYYDPTYPYYVIGFFSPTYTSYYNRNLIHIDAWNWWERVGAEGTQWFPDTAPELVVPSNHAFAIEGTIAHEYQHQIHNDYNQYDEDFMNEGCSMYAEVICGYGIPWGHINSYLATPDNSLIEWGDQGDINILADYGVAALWAIYLSDHFGPTFLGTFVQDGIPGIEGLNVALMPFHHMTFDKVFRNFRIANLIHSDEPGGGIYNYKTLDLADANPIRVYGVQQKPKAINYGADFGTTLTILGYDTGISAVGAYGSDYIEFTKWNNPAYGLLKFDGDDTAIIPEWTLEDGVWYSGTGVDLMNMLIFGEATVDGANPVLTLTTMYGLEDFWDYGFVQVSTDGGATWTSLANDYTTYDHDPDAHPNVLANLPGLTGTVADWVTMDFDLSAYAGQTVLIGFRYVTDWGTTYDGWWIQADSVMVSGTVVTLTPALGPEVDFQVTMVIETTLTYCVRYREGRHYYTYYYTKTFYSIYDLHLKDSTEIGTTYLYKFHNQRVFMIVSPTMERGIADYSFAATKLFHCR